MDEYEIVAIRAMDCDECFNVDVKEAYALYIMGGMAAIELKRELNKQYVESVRASFDAAVAYLELHKFWLPKLNKLFFHYLDAEVEF